ncbi:MAG TPA: TSUP family transporter [Patescibacteria group bacterium]|nr:TSUP family transporter [Patescibacteria group bacterium]
MVIYLLVAGFVAAFIDSVVGGGGLISMPALLATGLPPGIVLGTNKVASILCSLTSTLSFLRSGKIARRLAISLFPLAFIGSVLGAYTVRLIPPEFLKPLVIILLVLIAVYTYFKKEWGGASTYAGMTGRTAWLSASAVFLLGFYDGFFGPGTGSFLIFVFLMMGFDFIVAAGNAKMMNLASNLGAVLTFIWLDSVNYQYGLIMGVSMIAGAVVGSRVAIRSGVTYVRPLFIIITTLLIGRQLWDVIMK